MYVILRYKYRFSSSRCDRSQETTIRHLGERRECCKPNGFDRSIGQNTSKYKENKLIFLSRLHIFTTKCLFDYTGTCCIYVYILCCCVIVNRFDCEFRRSLMRYTKYWSWKDTRWLVVVSLKWKAKETWLPIFWTIMLNKINRRWRVVYYCCFCCCCCYESNYISL